MRRNIRDLLIATAGAVLGYGIVCVVVLEWPVLAPLAA